MKIMLDFLLLLFAISVTCSYAIGSKCIGDQQLVSLLNMKKSLVFNASSSSKLVSWNSSTDCCSWLGITCSDDGRVTGLDISSESISDGIDNSSSLFHLQHLQSLNLAGNLLGGDANLLVPTAIGQLKNLRYLNLSQNYYSGQIPVEISYLTKLLVLDISDNTRLKLKSPNINMLVRNLTELTELHLSSVQISSQGSNWGQAISSLPI
ncbi:PREDICTED: probably inactive leucine-rich repeat receptor-like protein kinase At2g25790 [Fragaria vesca subsp. vesca]|uniref:probably inactive leucine-rich repeat receptor-like protein kinase At2g25790 n=1 Tax=Fragaria vesca subsp. vesca TaxID=101020 RepID=UPI0002C2E48B|nr:PREDICTED: probably inactive leucine-rich repeat receptor-like protein kinase At2g25790 [Fragaria vesca subsp. vesca]